VWVGKRSSSKATYPGMLDVLAAGGQPRSGTTHGDTKIERGRKGSGGQEKVGGNVLETQKERVEDMGVWKGSEELCCGRLIDSADVSSSRGCVMCCCFGGQWAVLPRQCLQGV
jgi:hypothetical protein